MSYIKKYYQIKKQIDHLSDRDRISLLAITLCVLFALWFLVLYLPQTNSIQAVNLKIEGIEIQTATIKQKELLIQSLVSSPDTGKLISHFKQLTQERSNLEKQFSRYSKRYISRRDLAKLLHEMLQQTFGVVIADFATVPQPMVPPPAQPTSTEIAATAQPVTVPLTLEPIHYRLVLRGQYFSIMNYLKRLEGMSWRLYWDKLDYSVTEYPEGVAAIEFYTLKPQNTVNSTQRGVNQ